MCEMPITTIIMSLLEESLGLHRYTQQKGQHHCGCELITSDHNTEWVSSEGKAMHRNLEYFNVDKATISLLDVLTRRKAPGPDLAILGEEVSYAHFGHGP
jgi:hypothetical protein